MKAHWLYRTVRQSARLLLPRLGSVEARNLDRLPGQGGALLLPNHQSALDPFLVQGWAPRPVRSMTKSTQFGSSLMLWALPRLGAFPVRRYQTDSQTVRIALRLLDEGEVVCIYPEGERTWDGEVGAFRRGTLRLAAYAMARGIPVMPVKISGMYDAFPRWGRPARTRVPMVLDFHEPLRVAVEDLRDRHSRDAALPSIEVALRKALTN
jgi:1-acyl-sn-glycerol-3-phosphate acyltransferase